MGIAFLRGGKTVRLVVSILLLNVLWEMVAEMFESDAITLDPRA